MRQMSAHSLQLPLLGLGTFRHKQPDVLRQALIDALELNYALIGAVRRFVQDVDSLILNYNVQSFLSHI